jgi:predicted DNA repair protein MutK
MLAVEKEKIRGAIRTDFVLSAEIIAITLGTVADAPFVQQVIVLAGIAIAMTIGVYGVVAGIVKLDDLGLYLSRKSSALARAVGAGILRAAPGFMKTLAVVGTAAMFLVGGGILVHGLPPLHHFVEQLAAAFTGALHDLSVLVLNILCGIVAGAIVLAGVKVVQRVMRKP